jgi:signal transduction histidine kinase
VSEPEPIRPQILYVDDDKGNRVVFEQALGDQFAVRCVADAATALQVLAAEEIAVVVTDMRMPAMSGEELLRVVKERHPSSIRIVVTAYADIDPILRAINEGLVARYIIKPWIHAELVQVLRWATEAWTFGRDSAALHRRLLETERLATLGTMAGAIAHDINQPLTPMVSESHRLAELAAAIPALRQALIGGYVSPHDHRLIGDLVDELPQIAADLKTSAQHVAALVASLTQFTRPRRTDQPPPIDPLPIVRHAVSVCEDIAIKANSTIHYVGPTELPRVRIWPTELTQVLINLVSNAAQAVAARGVSDGHVSIIARTDDGNLEVQVKDDGIGMPPEVLARVGTPFFTTRKEGTGLGLSQCQRLIGTAGGRFRIESEEGVGTTVTITLPLAA